MIHPSAIVHAGAKLAQDVAVGPFSVIGADVEIDGGTSIGSHAVIAGHTRIGRNNRIFHHVVLGEEPQDKKYGGEPTRLEIGDNNTIREFCTFNTGTVQDVGVTRVGDDNWIMAYAHIAHDSQVGSHTILANLVTLAGHVTIHDHVILGGGTMVHQFCRVGAHAFTAGSSIVLRDVPPYVMASGNSASPHGINVEGLKRKGFGADAIEEIRRAYKTLYKSGLGLEEAKEALREQASRCPELGIFVEFLDSSVRSIIR
ncbi:MAG TPA: acyl-ACP--UDP-N-acetylglucosamine O-acyltransferase [Burkholderiales bacterium]|nr:acyl-ACP--UDP-N-acetylglucosamine O-acyltransferase [Burkholderiales bacterium]